MPRRKIRDKSSTYRNSYTEEANREYRDEEFHWKSINYKDWIVEKGVRKYRVKWKPSYYKHHYYESTQIQNFLEYFKGDIKDTIPSKKGVKIIWKDSYIATDDITAN